MYRTKDHLFACVGNHFSQCVSSWIQLLFSFDTLIEMCCDIFCLLFSSSPEGVKHDLFLGVSKGKLNWMYFNVQETCYVMLCALSKVTFLLGREKYTHFKYIVMFYGRLYMGMLCAFVCILSEYLSKSFVGNWLILTSVKLVIYFSSI